MNQITSCHLPLLLLLVNLTDVCGSRIIGGEEVNSTSTPIKYQASLRFINYHFCGGILIDQQWVLSAAHCWRPKAWIRVHLGDHDITKEEGHEQIFGVEKIIMHSRYHYWTLDNDIMLLKLDGPADFNTRVHQVQLPEPESTDGLTECTVSGWGVTGNFNRHLSPVLRSVNVDFIRNCRRFYSGVTSNMICAGILKGGKDACRGDSGGPLVCNGTLHGIVSWGYRCAYPYYPGVYTKVSNYLSWIRNTINTN